VRASRGFTLLELLIAIAIFALLGLGTYRMLDSVLKTDKVTRTHEMQLRELVRAMAAFERDVLQVQARPVRDPFGDTRAALLGEDLDSPALELTRNGWRNPLGQPRSSLQRVRWQLSGEQWQRQYWTVLDQAQDSQPQVQQALDGVTRLQLRYMDQKGNWQASWPPLGNNPDDALKLLPQAVELVIEHRRYGEVRRLLRLPEGLPEGLAPVPGENPAEPEAGDESPVEPQP
jgi:general secretion pathway protein J